jgi:hypothetical protein
VVQLVTRPPLSSAVLVVDETGVGRPVTELLALAMPGRRLLPVTITAGHVVIWAADGWGVNVPKKMLVSTMQVLLQADRLKVARGLAHAATLARELQAFRVKVTAAANETFEAWRERDHNDMVLAVALAAWAGETAVAIEARRDESGNVAYLVP